MGDGVLHGVWEPLEHDLGLEVVPGEVPGVIGTGESIPPGEWHSELRPDGEVGEDALGSWLILCRTSLNSRLEVGEDGRAKGCWVGEVGAGGEGGEVGAREETSDGSGPEEEAGEGIPEQDASKVAGDIVPLGPLHHSTTF